MSTAQKNAYTPIDSAFVHSALPARGAHSHKGVFGRLLVLAGSSRYRGAALLAAQGALRSGAGIVQLASIECVCAAAAVRLPCCTLLSLSETPQGGITPDAWQDIDGAWPTAMLVGSGMGAFSSTRRIVAESLQRATCPLVLDADALNVLPELLRQHPHLLKNAAHPPVLTPHVGEMARLCEKSTEEVRLAMGDVALEYAASQGCIVVLKSHHTAVATPDGHLFVNETAGNVGLAKGGSGDVLAGIISSLIAQGLPLQNAAAIGVFLHATAADTLATTCGFAALSPEDLPNALGAVLRDFGW